MNRPATVSIVFYDENSEQLKFISIFQREIQGVIDKEMARSGGMTIPLGAEDGGCEPLTDEEARRLGGLIMLMHAALHPELRDRLEITTAEPVEWSPVKRPE